MLTTEAILNIWAFLGRSLPFFIMPTDIVPRGYTYQIQRNEIIDYDLFLVNPKDLPDLDVPPDLLMYPGGDTASEAICRAALLALAEPMKEGE